MKAYRAYADPIEIEQSICWSLDKKFVEQYARAKDLQIAESMFNRDGRIWLILTVVRSLKFCMARCKLNHRELCEVGARFLKRPESANGHGCHFTIIEAACYGNPDVFGVRHGSNRNGMGHYLLEAKQTSRSDFLVDRNKPHRVTRARYGKYRYYICPTGLIKPEELPKNG